MPDRRSTRIPDGLSRLLCERPATLQELMLARVRRSPARPFLYWEDEVWTYEQALDEALAFAGWVVKEGSGVRPRVASYLPNRPEALWAWLGTVFAGRTFVPLNCKHRGALLREMIERSLAGILVTSLDALPELEGALDPIRHIVLVDRPNARTATPAHALHYAEIRSTARCTATSDAMSPACILYTSGTAGRSKAVSVLHHQYVRGAGRLAEAYDLGPDDVFHNWLPLYHLAGQLHMTLTAVVCGGSVALQPTFSVSRFWQEVNRRRCSVLCGFASILHFIESLPPAPSDAQSPLRVGIFAGIPAELHRRFERRFGMRLGENYGMTEIDPITCPEPGIEPPIGSCGRACPEVEVAIVDENDHRLPPGELGEIVVRPRVPGVLTPGYEQDDRATLSAFRNLWFHTADHGVLDAEGFLYFKGRSSHYIRRRGENVSVAELEGIVMTHGEIAECAVVGVPSEVGEEDIKLIVALKSDSVLTELGVWHFASERVARFMRPRYIEIVNALPRGDVGKVRIAELREQSARTWDAERADAAREADT